MELWPVNPASLLPAPSLSFPSIIQMVVYNTPARGFPSLDSNFCYVGSIGQATHCEFPSRRKPGKCSPLKCPIVAVARV
jgi:hypothetical protein